MNRIVRPIEDVEIKHYQDNYYTFNKDTWYNWGYVSNDHSSTAYVFIELPGGKWPNNTLQISKYTFDRLFVTKEEDRDIKINEILK